MGQSESSSMVQFGIVIDSDYGEPVMFDEIMLIIRWALYGIRLIKDWTIYGPVYDQSGINLYLLWQNTINCFCMVGKPGFITN